jgi:hypothetical protein
MLQLLLCMMVQVAICVNRDLVQAMLEKVSLLVVAVIAVLVVVTIQIVAF